MRQRLIILLRFYVTLVLAFVIMKPLFMLFNGAGHHVVFSDWFAVPVHGLALDLTTAGYLAALPWLALLVSIWIRLPRMRRLYNIYIYVISFLVALIFVADTCLYSFWNFKLDATIFNYIDSPRGITASVSPLYLIIVAVSLVAFTVLLIVALRWAVGRQSLSACRRRPATTVVFLLLGGLLFLAIRGGVGKSTANIGKVYYSNNQFLNHAAVNPAFSLFYSTGKAQNYSAQCNFFPEAERKRLFESLRYDTTSVVPDTLLTTQRPNVLIIIMEGFGGMFVESLGGKPGVAPNFERLSHEGVYFTNCYANSFRTDRGVVCTLSGYPALTTASVMKLPEKSRSLPSIAASLAAAGYRTDFLYGGDINFTNMNSYLLATRYQTVRGDTDFPISQRRTHAWGVTDRITFDRLYQMVIARNDRQPWHTAFLTLASHEPWKVPYNRIPGDEKANAMAYLDDCLGRFVERLRHTPQWDNLLIVCLPDHGILYPDTLDETHSLRNHIPMLWLGGAVKQPRKVEQICNQTDLPATLLGQLGLHHGQFRFSRDVVSRTYRYPCAINVWAGGLAFYDTSGFSVFDLASSRPLAEKPFPSTLRLNRGKAFLQSCFDDLANL